MHKRSKSPGISSSSLPRHCWKIASMSRPGLLSKSRSSRLPDTAPAMTASLLFLGNHWAILFLSAGSSRYELHSLTQGFFCLLTGIMLRPASLCRSAPSSIFVSTDGPHFFKLSDQDANLLKKFPLTRKQIFAFESIKQYSPNLLPYALRSSGPC